MTVPPPRRVLIANGDVLTSIDPTGGADSWHFENLVPFRPTGRYRPCDSPLRYWAVRGRHVLRVRAVGPTGLRGPAAIKHFSVRAPIGHLR